MNLSIKSKNKGFSLLELLIVIAILAILFAAVLIFLDPSETLRKTRDARRIADLAQIKKSIEMYIQDQVIPNLDGTSTTDLCSNHIWYSLLASLSNGCPTGKVCVFPSSTASSTMVDGSGWIPIDFFDISSGTPLPSLPIDPINKGNFYYTYGCNGGVNFELDAKLESNYYNNVAKTEKKDGGDAPNLYEVGDGGDLRILSPEESGFYK